MHRLRHHQLAKKLQFNSLLVIGRALSSIALIALLIATLFSGSLYLAMGAGLSFVIMVTLWLTNLATGNSCRCQLCQAPMMAQRKCSRHRKAKKLLGSYRLKLSSSFLFSDSFHCPFCGESFTSKVVEKSPIPIAKERTRPTLPISHMPKSRDKAS